MKTPLCIVSLLLVLNFHCGDAVDKFKLSSGYEIPAIGLGTFKIQQNEIEEAMANALESGYRHFDTAFVYRNEDGIGRALKKWFDKGGKREDLFITSKLPPFGNKPESVEKYLKLSLKDLGLEYVDMYLIHTPFGFKESGNLSTDKKNGSILFETVDHVAIWKKMEEQVRAGRAKSIGLSNFNRTQILNVYNKAEIKPSNLQVEMHPYLQQRELKEFCKKNNIVITAYAPLGAQRMRELTQKGTKKELPPLLDVPEIKDIAAKYNKTTGKVLLRYLLQSGLVAIPKSSNKERQRANIDIFDFSLSKKDMERIDSLDKGENGRVYDFVSQFGGGIDKDPQYPFPIPS